MKRLLVGILGVFTVLWLAHVAARLGGWDRLGLVVLGLVLVVAAVALFVEVERRDPGSDGRPRRNLWRGE